MKTQPGNKRWERSFKHAGPPVQVTRTSFWKHRSS